MNQIIRISLAAIILLVLSSCNLVPTPTIIGPVVRLTVQMQNGINTFDAVGQVVNYNYVVTNTGTVPLAGPVLILDAPRQATCPGIETVGNLDGSLDLNETVTCTAPYAITQADFDTGSVTNIATASVGGETSNQSGVTLAKNVAPMLTLSKTADPATYGQVGQTITYSYTITNSGTIPLGPAQFTINDDKFGTLINCGPADTTIAASQSLTCSAPYLISTGDLSSPNLTNSATALGAGQTSAAATVTVTNFTFTQTPATIETITPPLPGNLTPGSTVQHQVAVGEWLIQIARCYGATLSDVINANPQIPNPDVILPSMIVTVPRIGSAGTIYGPNQCVTFQTVQSGDTWSSIAQRYNACVAVLQRVNPISLVPGTTIKIAMNSANLYCSGSNSPGPAITFTPSPTGTTAAPMRITFDAGSTTASRIGIVNPNETVHFVLAAAQGQILSVNLIANANEVAIGIKGPTGLTLKPLDATQTWSATIADGGDYFIDITSILGNSTKSYTLNVTLLTPTLTPSPTTQP